MHRCTTNQQMQRKPTDALDQKESEDQKIVCEESDPILFPQPCRGQMIFSESTDLQDLPRNPGIEISSRNLEPMAKTMRRANGQDYEKSKKSRCPQRPAECGQEAADVDEKSRKRLEAADGQRGV